MAILNIDLLKTKLQVTDNEQDGLLQILIDQAKDIVTNEYFAYANVPDDWTFPEKFTYITLEVATHLYNKVGIEGQISHKEQSIDRVYEEGGIPRHLFDQLPRKPKVFSL